MNKCITDEDFLKHPLFRSDPIGDNEELSHCIEALQQLKYSEEDNSPIELINTHKNDGLFYFKLKQYKKAVLSFTEALKIQCDDKTLKAIILNNRAASNFYLENYRSSINDCIEALKLNPNYPKCTIRMANCYLKLSKFDQCLNICNQLPNNSTIVVIRNQCIELKNKEMQHKAVNDEDLLVLINDIKSLKMEDDNLEPIHEPLIGYRVHLQPGSLSNLIWPVIIYYAVEQIANFIQEFNETETLREHLEYIFESSKELDRNFKYKIDNVNVYFEKNGIFSNYSKVNINDTLGNILKYRKFLIKNGTPEFIIMLKNNKLENKV